MNRLCPTEPELLGLLREVLADPNPFDTAEAFARYHHDDLPHLDVDEIGRERWRLRCAWGFGVLSNWGTQRLAALDREAERRRRRPRASPSPSRGRPA